MMKLTLIILLGIAGTLAGTSSKLGWRIVGGDKAADGQFPYQITLKRFGRHRCGGSILDETTVLSAAHCVDDLAPSSFTVVTGTNKLDSGGDTYQVKSYIVHERYDGVDIQNDIAIIKLSSPIKLGSRVQKIALRQNNIGGEEDCNLSGWGLTSYPGDEPNDLQFIKLRTLSHDDCKKLQIYPVIESEVCTLTKRGEGTCFGDSGGPLVDSNGEQIGIVSWSAAGCAQGKPDVYTRVFSFLDWIEKNRN